MDDSRLVEMRTFIDRPMNESEPTTAREWLSAKRREEYKFHTQDPYSGADFDAMIKRINASMGQPSKHLGNRDSTSLSKEILGFNLLPEK